MLCSQEDEPLTTGSAWWVNRQSPVKLGRWALWQRAKALATKAALSFFACHFNEQEQGSPEEIALLLQQLRASSWVAIRLKQDPKGEGFSSQPPSQLPTTIMETMPALEGVGTAFGSAWQAF